MTILAGRDLAKRYGTRDVVRDINLDVRQGEVVGVLGPNGAGKTTTFYMLAGIVPPTRGQVLVDDQDITRWPLHRRARAGMSYLPQESSIFRKLTVRQNLQLILEYSGFSPDEQKRTADRLLDELGIARLEGQLAAYLSGGERRRLEIARALIQDPKFILLDEPFAGIDPLAVDDIQTIIKGLRSKGIGVLISDHNVRETLQICDRAYLVYDGQIILNGSPEEIVADPAARRVYLGEGFSL
ncbi:MAG: LPS export ABC transporter ATP-binding protein [Desulfomicrobium sp.]|nr:LPS export ABC transporter ATP-binding protein [Pseudomonadota bacterium]MBV1711200.1 LPS export ABC transporter ATP-binding protein [Desulfomicrobium sp.]MBU4569871.1 LPS export ABC transporter ATP-binding protein [Pseudomonadota bacterium]MBU4594970.1 LPS export ABC transporter ATP-binding protein [Pseudomonadota bacterium]MBV1718910.1 LPS export ABC transporter ATP-binding protein [Desulfomicrobium sp.]